MKIQLMSDLHVEFNGKFSLNFFEFSDKCDAVIICGDTMPLKDLYTWSLIFDKIKKYGKDVYYVLGNHDYYRCKFDQANKFIKNKEISNFHLLIDEAISLSDNKTILFGGTMWSDFNLVKDKVKINKIKAKNNISDFHMITYKKDKLLSPDDCARRCRIFKKKLKKALETYKDKQILVATHFACHERSIADKFINNDLNPYFVTDCSEFFEQENNIIGWVHGHTHYSVDYTINGKFIKCNPYGIKQNDKHETFQKELILNI